MLTRTNMTVEANRMLNEIINGDNTSEQLAVLLKEFKEVIDQHELLIVEKEKILPAKTSLLVEYIEANMDCLTANQQDLYKKRRFDKMLRCFWTDKEKALLLTLFISCGGYPLDDITDDQMFQT